MVILEISLNMQIEKWGVLVLGNTNVPSCYGSKMAMFVVIFHNFRITEVNLSKGNRRRSIGHCPHLWNPPLQPIHHSQQSDCLWYKYNELVLQHCGGFDDAWVVWMLYWMHPQKHHITGTLVHCSCLTIKDFTVQAGMVVVETNIDVGNILWIFYDCLCSKNE